MEDFSVQKKLRCWEYVLVDVRFRVFVVICFAVFIGLGVPYMLMTQLVKLKSEDQKSQCKLDHELRVNCFPGIANDHQNKEDCEKAECCWEKFESTVPSCFHSYPTSYSYFVGKVLQKDHHGDRVELSAAFENTSTGSSGEKTIYVDIEPWSEKHLRILIYRNLSFDPLPHLNYGQRNETINAQGYNYFYPVKGRFYITVSRKLGLQDKSAPQMPIFNTIYGPLIISRGLAEITTLLPSFNIFGIGQNPKNSFRQDLKIRNKSALFSRAGFENDTPITFSMAAGVHPFYMVTEKDGLTHGVLLLSTVPAEIVTSAAPAVTFRTADGRLDFHIFLGPTPSDVIRQLTTFIGLPSMPPFWALGYHSCRNILDIEKAIKYLNYTRSKEILHESDCGSAKLFQLPRNPDSLEMARLKRFRSVLDETETKFLLFQSPYLLFTNKSNLDENLKFDSQIEACESNSLNVRNADRQTFAGHLPDGTEVGFVDYFQSDAIGKWLSCTLRALNNTIVFDAISLDSNIPLNSNLSGTSYISCHGTDSSISSFSPLRRKLEDGTICMIAIHANDVQHKYIHNIYGYKHLFEVRRALQGISRIRWFVTSLSTFSGSGSHGGHWGGQLNSTWSALKQSIIQTLDFNIFGMPLIGAPACGSYGDLDEDLCSRWIQVAAFQPLMFTHRSDDKEPLLDNDRLTSVASDMTRLRYSLLPFLYSLFYNASKYGDTVLRSLMFEFPRYPQASAIDEQFMWGSALLISPVLRPSAHKITSYFPPGCWYDYYTGKIVSNTTDGAFQDLIAFRSRVNLHIRGGYVIPSQIVNTKTDLSTIHTRSKNLTISIALNCDAETADEDRITAYGELFIDDGHSANSIDEGNYLLVSIETKGRCIGITPQQNNFQFENVSHISRLLNDVHIYGMLKIPSEFVVDGKMHNCSCNGNLKSAMLQNLNLDLLYNHTICWKTSK